MQKHNVMTTISEADQQFRNKQRLMAAIKSMGEKYICHPVNRVPRLAQPQK